MAIQTPPSHINWPQLFAYITSLISTLAIVWGLIAKWGKRWLCRYMGTLVLQSPAMVEQAKQTGELAKQINNLALTVAKLDGANQAREERQIERDK